MNIARRELLDTIISNPSQFVEITKKNNLLKVKRRIIFAVRIVDEITKEYEYSLVLYLTISLGIVILL